jgi:hypothetical protein
MEKVTGDSGQLKTGRKNLEDGRPVWAAEAFVRLESRDPGAEHLTREMKPATKTGDQPLSNTDSGSRHRQYQSESKNQRRK